MYNPCSNEAAAAPVRLASARSFGRSRGFARWAISSLATILECRHGITWFRRGPQEADPVTALRVEVFHKRAR
jgi:hypothetical protein